MKKWKFLPCHIGVFLFLLLIIVTNLFHFNAVMNADIASDVILGKLIWTSKEIIPGTWYRAAETRIICMPNVTALFYGLTKNMTLAAGLSCSSMTMLILASMLFCCKRMGFTRVEQGMFAFMGLAFWSNMIMLELLYLFACYYAVHVVTLFFTLGIYAEGIKTKKVGLPFVIVSIALAFCLGLQGTRGILVLYGPLFGIEAIRILYQFYCKEKREKADYLLSVWVCGLLVISFIGTMFPFSIGQEFSRNIRKGPQKLAMEVLPNMGKAVGFWQAGILADIILGILVLLVLFLLGNLLYRMGRKKAVDVSEWVFLVVSASPVVTALIVAFTTFGDSERYYFLLVYAMVFAVVLMRRRINRIGRGIGVWLIIMLAAINIYRIYLPILGREEPPKTDAYEVGQYLEEHEYFTAYATFENANTITVLTNGSVRVAAVASVDKMDICRWMTSTDWYVPNVPFEEKTAYVVTESERDMFDGFLEEHGEDVWFEGKIGKYLIYASNYNFSTLGEE